MARERIGNVRGPRGIQGIQGIPGPEAVPTDEALAANLKNAVPTQTQKATRRLSASNGGLYMPTEYAAVRWRYLRALTLSGARQGHIAIVGDSIAAGTGAWISNPKSANNWPGRLRARLNREFGDAGTGVVIMDNTVTANPTFESRIAVTGTKSTTSYGFFRAACLVLPGASDGQMYFNVTQEDTWIYNLSSTGAGVASATSGGVTKTFRNNKAGATVPDVAPEADYLPVVSRIPWGSVAARNVNIKPPAVGGDLNMIAVEGRVNTLGSFRLSNAAVLGSSLWSLFGNPANNDETNGFFGLPLVDMLRADLLIIALGINDWQAARSISDVKTMLRTLIDRQKASGTVGGSQRANGDVMLLWHPQPDIATLQPGAGPQWEEYRQAYYDIADEKNVPLLDLGLRYKDYATASSIGMIADTIHLGDVGSIDAATAVHRALFV